MSFKIVRLNRSVSSSICCFAIMFSGFFYHSGAFGLCTVDEPDCACFVDGGEWDPMPGTSSEVPFYTWAHLLDVANDTLGTVESCPSGGNGGKPFWQIQQGFSSADAANASGPDYQTTSRSAWCSEAVAYWHHEAQQPYNGGFYTDWHPGWQITNTTGMREWYETEEGLIGGRGRWIKSTELDLDNFQPGVNAPCPGAYQQLMAYDPSKAVVKSGKLFFLGDPWAGSGDAHSQVVESMVVYRKPNGRVVDFDLQMIEGNSGNRVRNDQVYASAPRYTPQGSEYLSTDRKIRGWGIDLDRHGNTLCALPNITYQTVPYTVEDIVFLKAPFPPKSKDDYQVAKNLRFAKILRKARGPMTLVNRKVNKSLRDLLTGRSKGPVILADRKTHSRLVNVGIKYPEPLPLPVKALEFRFSDNAAPSAVRFTVIGHQGGPVAKTGFQKLVQGQTIVRLEFQKQMAIKGFQAELRRTGKQLIKLEMIAVHYDYGKDTDVEWKLEKAVTGKNQKTAAAQISKGKDEKLAESKKSESPTKKKETTIDKPRPE